MKKIESAIKSTIKGGDDRAKFDWVENAKKIS